KNACQSAFACAAQVSRTCSVARTDQISFGILQGNSWSAGKALGALLFWWRHSQCNFWTRCFTRLGALWPTREVSLSVDRRGMRIYRGVAKRLDSPGRRGSNEGRGATGAATRRLET